MLVEGGNGLFKGFYLVLVVLVLGLKNRKSSDWFAVFWLAIFWLAIFWLVALGF